jgi:hypothetical protein
MTARVREINKAMKELTKTIFHGSVGERSRLIKDALRTRHEKPSLRPQFGTECAQHGKPSILAENGAETAGRGSN